MDVRLAVGWRALVLYGLLYPELVSFIEVKPLNSICILMIMVVVFNSVEI